MTGFDLTKEITYEDLRERLEDLSLQGSCCMRYGGYQIIPGQNETKITAWQCNMADVQNFDVRLPTVISLTLDGEDRIRSIELKENFKGSQGMICSRTYLDRKLKELYQGRGFSSQEKVFQDQYLSCCRHTYELMYGAVNLLEHCRRNGQDREIIWMQEITRAFHRDHGLDCEDRIELNGKMIRTRILIENLQGNIQYNAGGKVVSARNIRIQGLEEKEGVWYPIRDAVELNAESYLQYTRKLMKAVSPFWLSSGRRLGVRMKFYFSQIWGPTFFGILSQALGLVIFNNNYAYFQHCIYGMQRSEDGKPFCIGVSDDLDDVMANFPDFQLSDI